MTTITLPIPDGSRACPEPLRNEAGSAAPLILLVDDDSRTLRFVLTVLRYATAAVVLEASDPGSAIEAARAAGRPIDLLLSDVDLAAGKTGIDLARELAQSNPLMKVAFMSGRDLPQCDLAPGWRFLAKPFAIAALLDCMDALGLPVSARWREEARPRGR